MNIIHAVIAGTGHRPDHIHGYNNSISENAMINVARGFMNFYKPLKVISGLAQGWDTAIALAALNLNIHLECAIPFVGQDSNWPQTAKDVYKEICDAADEVTIVCEGGYAGYKFIQRDYYMVDCAGAICALDRKLGKGGTYQTVKYAHKKGIKVYNMWDAYLKAYETSGGR